MNKIITFALLALLLNGINLYANNDISFSKVDVDEGLTQQSVMSIYQDELGTIWFGTRQGVNRYNGNSMEVFQPFFNSPNSAGESIIVKICGNRNGFVFILTQNGINQYNLKTGEIVCIQNKLTDDIFYGQNKLWIAEGNKVYTYSNAKKQYYGSINSKSPITRIFETTDHRLLLGTFSSGLFELGKNQKGKILIPELSQISDIFEDRGNNIWVSTFKNGLYKIDQQGITTNLICNIKSSTTISSNFVRAITQDNQGRLWIGTNVGLDRLTIETGEVMHFDGEVSDIHHLSDESVWSLMKDLQGNIWVGTYYGGANYFNPEVQFFTYHDFQNGVFKNKHFPIIGSIIEDKNQKLYLCTEGRGLIVYNPKDKSYVNFRNDPNNSNSLTSNNVKTAYLDEQSQELWLGTHLGGMCKLNLKTSQFTSFKNIFPELNETNVVRSILPYKNKLLIATYGGVFLFDKETNQYTLLSQKLHEVVKHCFDIKLDKKNNIWIASNIGVIKYNLLSDKYQYYSYHSNNPRSISNNNATVILIDSKEKVWIGTNGGGLNLYNEKTDDFTKFDSENSKLKNNYISNIIEARSGNLITTTTQGFAILDVKKNLIQNYGSENGISVKSLFNGGLYQAKSGELFLGGLNGFISFYEENLKIRQKKVQLFFSKMWVNGKLVSPNDESGILDLALPYSKSINLNYKQTDLIIELGSNNYILVNKPYYRYRLDGFSDKWSTLEASDRKLNFMNMKSGSYTLIVEARSPSNGSLISSIKLNININPPFYESWYAFLFYIVIIALAVWKYLNFTKSKILLESDLKNEKNAKAHIEEVNQSKLNFFTNISHEFRTPLTLIIGQLELLLQVNSIPPNIYNRLLSIKRNTNNMQKLITELLEFRKIEQGHLDLRICKQDIVKFLKEIHTSYSELANYKNIELRIICNEEEILLWFDKEQMLKVFYNLLSNAFKFTPANGSIEISIEEREQEVYIKISDSGIGINQNELSKIFDKFYQAENGLTSDVNSPGTGIGLALTKNIIQLHSAQIAVESKLKLGTTFKISIKKGSAHFDEKQIVLSANNDDIVTYEMDPIDSEFFDEIKDSQTISGEPNYTILVVEDNIEICNFLKTILDPIYKVLIANDGEEGLELAIEKQPDIILSDLRMPKMSGSQMCSKIKQNISTSHIPVVLLTAQTDIENNIEGLQSGADDYVTKPFNIKQLITRCNNLINGRKLLQEKYSKQVNMSTQLLASNTLDREFIEQTISIIEKNIDNQEFDIQMFSQAMLISRTKLFNKIKGITGQTPNEFIFTFKMKKAAYLLKSNPELNIFDITCMLGFDTQKYFGKCFKDHFGVSPTAYRNEG